MEPKPNRSRLYFSVFILNIVYVACGTTFSWPSPVLLKLGLSDAEGSRVVSMLSLGSILGPFTSKFVLDTVGRKGTVGLSMLVLTMSWLILTYGDGTTVLSTGRFIAGAVVGVISSSIPLYIAEISENSVRGFLNTLSQISVCVGTLMVYSIGPFISYFALHCVLLGICAVFFIFFPFLPDSPYSLVMKNEISAARKTLMWLRTNQSISAVNKELDDIQGILWQNRVEKGSIKDLILSPESRHTLFVCSFLVTLPQISGISVLFCYTEQIFRMTGTDLSSSTCSIVVGVIMLMSSFLSPTAVSHLGYKTPLLISILGMGLGMGGLSTFFLLKSNDVDITSIYWLPLLSLIVYMLFFNVGFSNIPWALSGELFNSKVKSQATALISSTCGFFAFLSTDLFTDLVSLVGHGVLFLSCSVFCLIGAVFVLLCVHDTSKLSFAQIQELMTNKNQKGKDLKFPIHEKQIINV